MDQSFLSIPLISTFIFWLMGITGKWRRTVVISVLSYAAIILAYQHYRAFGEILIDTFGLHMQPYQSVAIGFGSCLVVALIGLFILYNALWKPTSSSQEQSGGGSKLIQSIMTGLVGWALGVLIAVCYLQIQYTSVTPQPSDLASIPNIIFITVKIINTSVHPWLVNSFPGFLAQLGL